MRNECRSGQLRAFPLQHSAFILQPSSLPPRPHPHRTPRDHRHHGDGPRRRPPAPLAEQQQPASSAKPRASSTRSSPKPKPKPPATAAPSASRFASRATDCPLQRHGPRSLHDRRAAAVRRFQRAFARVVSNRRRSMTYGTSVGDAQRRRLGFSPVLDGTRSASLVSTLGVGRLDPFPPRTLTHRRRRSTLAAISF